MGFVYIWYDRKHRRFYVGSHWGSTSDGYICSSNWMKKAYAIRPHDFKRRIVKSGLETKKLLLAEEQRWLSMIKPSEMSPNSNSPRYYNLKRGAAHWSSDPDASKTIGEKIRATRIANGTYAWTDEARKNLSKAKKGNPSCRIGGTRLRGRTRDPEVHKKAWETRRATGKDTWTHKKKRPKFFLEEHILREHIADGETLASMGSIYGKSPATMMSLLRHHGIENPRSINSQTVLEA